MAYQLAKLIIREKNIKTNTVVDPTAMILSQIEYTNALKEPIFAVLTFIQVIYNLIYYIIYILVAVKIFILFIVCILE
jgi:hypothetical protein